MTGWAGRSGSPAQPSVRHPEGVAVLQGQSAHRGDQHSVVLARL